MNICEHLTRTASLVPDRDAIRFDGISLTYAQLNNLSIAVGCKLRAAGIQPGDRVAIKLGNVPAFVVWYYAALRIGAVPVSISTRSSVAEATHVLTDCDAKVLVADAETLGQFQNQLPSCIETSLTTSYMGDACNDESLTIEPYASRDWFDANPNDPAVILYTSGTTGFPKGATLSHLNVRSNACAFNHLCNMQPHDRMLSAVPLSHCFGQNALLNSAFNVGATLVLQRKFDLLESKRLIADERVTQLYGVPMMFQLFLESCDVKDLASINYCFSAAATLPIQVSRQWQQKFGMPINEGYGLTETSPFASYNHRLKFVSGSIGTPIDNVEMRVVDTETGEVCLPGELGEIIIRGPNVMLGYWDREEETRSAIRSGWFHSGDIGRIDEQGYFYIVDRVKDMISVGGLKVFPAEVERVILDHPLVAEVAVVGVADDVFGERVVAFVVLTGGESPVDPQLNDIRQHSQSHLANYKTPQVVVPIDELPRNPSGKVLKRELRDFDLQSVIVGLEATGQPLRAESTTQTPVLKPPRPTLRGQLESTHAAGRLRVANDFVLELVQSMTGRDEPPEPTARFLDIGFDSLTIVEMSQHVQVELGPEHDVPTTLLFDHPRICDLSEYLVAAVITEELSPVEIAANSWGDDQQRSDSTESRLRQEIEVMTEDDALQELMKELETG